MSEKKSSINSNNVYREVARDTFQLINQDP